MAPLPFRRRKDVLPPEQATAERALEKSLRTLSRALQMLADLVEARRVQRQGHDKPGAFLKRTDKKRR